jgi:pimeloyl-ACP methyl ester carboxylesterase
MRFAAGLLLALAAEPTTVESGKFLIYQAGKPIGQEVYTHTRQDDRDVWSATVELENLGMRLRQQPRLVLGPRGPERLDLEYSVSGQGGSASYDFRDKTYTVTRKGGAAGDATEEHPLPSDAVVLLNNVLHHNILLARRYDWKKGGRQQFTALPSTPVVVEERAQERFRLSGRPVVLRHLFVTVAGAIGANLWVDSDVRVVKMDFPLQRAEIFLEGFEKIAPEPHPTAVPAGIDALDVDYPSGDHRMAATLTLPARRAERLPAVVLISGSGPQNRDEDSEGVGGVKLGLFRAIAERLSRAGIAVLRYDDRGVGQSGGNFATATMTDLEEDARAALRYLETRPEIDPRRIGIVGHSEGAILGARIAADLKTVKALVLMAGTAENGRSILRWQAERALFATRLAPKERKAAAEQQEEFFRLVDAADGEVAEVQGQTINVGWFKEFLTFDPLSAVRRIGCAVAILQGERDVQVPPDDARRLKQALNEAGNADSELHTFPLLGHVFTESSGEGIAELADPQKRPNPEFLDVLAGFLARKL